MFFICHLADPWQTLGHCQGDSVFNAMLINHCISDAYFNQKVTGSPKNEVESLSLSKHLIGFVRAPSDLNPTHNSGFQDHLICSKQCKDKLDLGLSIAATEFSGLVQVGIFVYITHCKY